MASRNSDLSFFRSNSTPAPKVLNKINLDDADDMQDQLTANRVLKSGHDNRTTNANPETPELCSSKAKTLNKKVFKRPNINVVEKAQETLNCTNKDDQVESGTAAKMRKTTDEMNQLEHYNTVPEGTDVGIKLQGIKVEIKNLSCNDEGGMFNIDVLSKPEPVELNDNEENNIVKEEEVFSPDTNTTTAAPIIIGAYHVKQEETFETHQEEDDIVKEEEVFSPEINTTTAVPFIIGSYHVKQEELSQIDKEEKDVVNEDEKVFSPEINTTTADPIIIGAHHVKQEQSSQIDNEEQNIVNEAEEVQNIKQEVSSDMGVEEIIIQEINNPTTLPPDVLKNILDQYTGNFMTSADVEFLRTLPFEKTCITNKKYKNLKRIKVFAMYLYLCSVKTYRKIAEHFIPCLPSGEEILQEWITTEGSEGFSKEALYYLEQKASMTLSEIFCCLIINDNPLQRYKSFIITVVALNASWKVPICYFITSCVLEGTKRAKILEFAVYLIESIGLIPISVTYEPNCQNMVMAEILTPKKELSYVKLVLTKKGNTVYLLPDPIFALESFKWSNLINRSGEAISMERLELLTKNWKLGNRLLRKSVQQSLQRQGQIAGNADLGRTADFLTKLNDFIDIITSHTAGEGQNRRDLYDLLEYFISLSVPQEAEVLSPDTPKFKLDMKKLMLNLQTAVHTVLGLAAFANRRFHLDMMKLTMASTLFIKTNFQLPFDLCSKNEFIARYKESLKHCALIENNNTNIIPLEKIALISEALSPLQKINRTNYDLYSNLHIFRTEIEDDLYKILITERCEYHEDYLRYITRYVVFNLMRTLHCIVCISALLKRNPFEKNEHYISVISYLFEKPKKQKSSQSKSFCLKLMDPSPDVLKICKSAENVFKKIKNERGTDVDSKMVMMSKFRENMIGEGFFKDLDFHRLDGDTLYNHVVVLPQAVAETYLDIRLKYIASSN